MSKETSEWLNQNVLVGFTSKRGNAWHYRASDQGTETNHYLNAIPVEDVERRLFNWQAQEFDLSYSVPCAFEDADMDHFDDDGLTYKTVSVPDHKLIGRSDTHEVFRVFRSGYTIHQYDEWLLKSVADLLDDDLSIASAGLLKNGGVAWVSIELPDNIQTPSGFTIRPQLLSTTSHNGSLSTTFKQTATAVVCDNTLSWGLKNNGQVFRSRHSSKSTLKLGDARKALELVHTGGESIVSEIERLSSIDVTKKQFDLIVNQLSPVPTLGDSNQAGVTRAENRQYAVRRLWETDPRVTPWAGTALGVVQAWNTYNHHLKGAETSRTERNMMNTVSGKTDKDDDLVMEVIKEVVMA